jgi:tetratricopeptide (TPR) repeat protein
MTDQELLDEALRLTDSGDYAEAVKLWERLRNLAALDVDWKCVLFLNERKCRTALGQFETSAQLLDTVENMDTTGQFQLEIELARIDNLYKQGKFVEGNKRCERFGKENASKLVNPQFAIIASEQKLALACGLVSAKELAAGLHLLSEILPAAEDQDKPQILYYRSLAYLGLKQEDTAIDDLKQILVLAGHDQWAATAHYDLGRIYENRRAFAWAKQHLQNAELLKDVITFPISYVYMSLSNVCFKLHELEEGWRYRKLAESRP